MDEYKNSSGRRSRDGAGGILLGLADFPLLLGIKIKFLFDAATLYGFDTSDKEERLFILHVFQLAFQVMNTEKKYGKPSKRGIQKKKTIWTGKSSKQSTETISI